MEGVSTNDVETTGDIVKETMIVPHMPDDTMSIAEFLKRPRRVWSVSLTSGSMGTITVNPWLLYFNNPQISRKISNFLKIHTGGMHVTIVTNSTPFTYGRLGVAYMPQYSSHAFSSPTAQRLSTMPYFSMIDPARDTTLEFDIPEFVQEELLVPKTDYNHVGAFLVQRITNLASSASAGSAVPAVNMQMFVNLIAPKLVYGTTSPSYYGTSGEYKGVLSGPLGTIAKASGVLSKVPVLKPFATAAGNAAAIGASLANMFGYSRPPNSAMASDPTFQNRYVGNMANVVGLDTTTVLAMEPNAISCSDPQYFGLPATDELVLSEIASRYSLVATFGWYDTSAIDTDLYSMYVGPSHGLSHLAFASRPFQYWRGSIKFKIVFPVSHFHTGRMRVTFTPYEPTPIIGLDPSNLQLTWIIDLTQGSELEIVIPYSYHRPMCPVTPMSNYSTGSFPNDGIWTMTPDILAMIGNLSFSVVTTLRCGSAATGISPLIFIAAGDDFELFGFNLMNHRNLSDTYETFPTAVNSGLIPALKYKYFTGASSEIDSPLIAMNAASERIVSFRPLLKRYQLTDAFPAQTFAGNVMPYRCVRQYPNIPGSVVNTNNNYAGTYNTATTAHSLFSYLMPAYCGTRGGMRLKLVGVDSNASLRCVQRITDSCTSLMSGSYGLLTDVTAQTAMGVGIGAGGEIIKHSNRYGFEVTLPHYSDLQFYLNADLMTAVYPTPGVMVNAVANFATTSPIHVFRAAADDFNFLWYTGQPDLILNPIAAPGLFLPIPRALPRIRDGDHDVEEIIEEEGFLDRPSTARESDLLLKEALLVIERLTQAAKTRELHDKMSVVVVPEEIQKDGVEVNANSLTVVELNTLQKFQKLIGINAGSQDKVHEEDVASPLARTGP